MLLGLQHTDLCCCELEANVKLQNWHVLLNWDVLFRENSLGGCVERLAFVNVKQVKFPPPWENIATGVLRDKIGLLRVAAPISTNRHRKHSTTAVAGTIYVFVFHLGSLTFPVEPTVEAVDSRSAVIHPRLGDKLTSDAADVLKGVARLLWATSFPMFVKRWLCRTGLIIVRERRENVDVVPGEVSIRGRGSPESRNQCQLDHFRLSMRDNSF